MGMPADTGAQILPPAGDGTVPNKEQRLANTGTTESSNSTALDAHRFATLKVGSVAIRATWHASTGLATQTATTDMLIQAGEFYHWWVTPDRRVVYIEAGDGASTYEAWVWNSSP